MVAPKPKAVIIGNNVWIGPEAIIISGVTFGDGAVVGVWALIAKVVPPYTIVGGNLANIIKQRFDDDTISRLLALKWWDWDDERVSNFLPLLLDTNIGNFLDSAERNSLTATPRCDVLPLLRVSVCDAHLP